MQSCLVFAVTLFIAFENVACRCHRQPPAPVCVQRNPATVIRPKRIITGIRGPHNILITPDKDVFITGYFDRFVYRLDLAGNIKQRYKLPRGNPCMLDLNNGELYVTNVARTVFKARYSKNTLGPFQNFLPSINRPVGFRISKDGNRIYAAEYTTGIIRVYNKLLQQVRVIRVKNVRYIRKILVDADGNLNIATYTPIMHVYSPNGNFIRTIAHAGVGQIDGFVINCDGSRVLADRRGRVVFADKNGRVIKTISGFGMSQPADVAIAPDRTLWVADVIGHKVFLF